MSCRPHLDRFENGRLRVIADLDLGWVAVAGAHDLNQVMPSDRIPRLPIEDVVQPRLGATLILQSLKEQQGIGDPPPRVGVDPDEPPVSGRNLVGIAVPLEEPLVEEVGSLNERYLEVQNRAS